jgi:hypothetical protein
MYLSENTNENEGFLLTPRTGRQLTLSETYVISGMETIYLVIESGSSGEINAEFTYKTKMVESEEIE